MKVQPAMPLPTPDIEDSDQRYSLQPTELLKPSILLRVSFIALVCAGLCGSLAFAAGLFQPANLTQDKVVDRLESVSGKHPGFRRNHAKGICASGYFVGSGDGVPLSTAAVFREQKTLVFGRFALAGPNPFQPDTAGQIRSMALNFTLDNGNLWRTGMNNIPVFTVKNVEGFYDLLDASRPDPETGKPDPAKMDNFFEKHPESAISISKVKSRRITSGFADSTYNALNAFYFTNASGKVTPVRWSMIPFDPIADYADPLGDSDPNFLFDGLSARFSKGPVAWKMIATLGQPGDPLDDATKAWPNDRQKITLGALTLTTIEDEEQGRCRDVNFDPLILPNGIEPSADPLLSARSAAYSRSFTRREGEKKSPSAVSHPAQPQSGSES